MSELSHLGAYRLIHKGQLTDAEHFALRGHLRECAECREHAIMAGVLSNHFVLEASSARPSPRFTAVFKESAARRSRRSQIMKPVYAVGGLAVLALIVLAGWFIVRANPETTTLEAMSVETAVVAMPEVHVTAELIAATEVADEDLVEAVTAEDADAVERLLEVGANPDAIDSAGAPILRAAIRSSRTSGSTDIVELLVAHGADVNALDRRGYALLPQAARDGQLEVVQLLLDAGADVDGPINDGWGANDTGLARAAINNHIKIVELLIAHGADVNHAESNNGYTVLIDAAYYNNPEIITILLENGADPNLHCCPGFGGTALHGAAENGRLEAAQALLDGGADVNVQTDLGVTPLMSVTSSAEIITLLLERGADPNLQNLIGSSALHYAAQKGMNETIPILIEHGATIDLQNNEGNTALHQAALLNKTGAVSVLIEQGASLELKNDKGETVLDVAANDEITEMLREVGAGE